MNTYCVTYLHGVLYIFLKFMIYLSYFASLCFPLGWFVSGGGVQIVPMCPFRSRGWASPPWARASDDEPEWSKAEPEWAENDAEWAGDDRIEWASSDQSHRIDKRQHISLRRLDRGIPPRHHGTCQLRPLFPSPLQRPQFHKLKLLLTYLRTWRSWRKSEISHRYWNMETFVSSGDESFCCLDERSPSSDAQMSWMPWKRSERSEKGLNCPGNVVKRSERGFETTRNIYTNELLPFSPEST